MELQLRKSLFWDINIDTINLQTHRVAVIERITLRGRFQEFKDVIKYYGKEVVKNILLNIRYLDKVTLSFCSTIFDVPKTEFRCYKLAQSNPEHWNY
jgi:hypothetical protein